MIIEDLTPKEQQLLAFCLFTTGMRIGPDVFETLESIAVKLGVETRLALLAVDFTAITDTIRASDVQGVDLFQKPRKTDG